MKKYFDDTTEEVLHNLEETQKQFWNISRVTAEFLYTLIKSENAKSVLEVGTSNGYSGVWLGKAVKETGGHLTTIEFWDKRLDIAKENFKICRVDDVITTLKGSACEILEELPEDFMIDIAFVDANKSEYIKYFELIDKHLRKGGIIACDNVLSHEAKCKPFIDAINFHPAYENVVLPLPAGLSFGRKIRDLK
ncbi:o-methyltransferase family 3 [Clostridium sp. CAG:967]|nr:o-methyltransferase family 3 [Clostridium sp. CAG:967]